MTKVTADIYTGLEHRSDGPADRPHPSLQEIYESDKIAPPAHMREESRIDMGNEDIPIERYFSKEYHDKEVEKVWRRTWQWACRLEDIPDVGSHIVYNIVHDSLIVVRTGPGPKDIKAYINACLHRGTMLRKEGGCVKKFRCPFHGFTWALDGTLDHIPEAWDFQHVDWKEFSLPEAKVDTWGGFVFINFDQDCEDLLSYLEILPEHFADYDLENRYKAIHVAKIMPCNWKLSAEAFVEAYHVPYAHPQSLPYYGDSNTQYDTYPGVRHINRMISAQGVPSPAVPDTDPEKTRTLMERDIPFYKSSDPVVEGQSPRERFAEVARKKISAASKRDVSQVSDTVALDLIQYTVFPNFVPYGGLGLSAGYRFRPYGDDPERSIMEIYFLFPKAEDGSHPPAPRTVWLTEDEDWSTVEALGSSAMVIDQDTDNLKRIQKGLRTTRKPGATLASYQESRIRHFHKTLDAYMAAD
ncbi:MAG: aromatic ring-hydroxylating dioxygenase subunit alpha [Erythrobacter sp.]|uniref:aromatic ring-hydroxylating oxygenase subunit alpha n=1 Tax=Erythrobacter sp. TaxID=1042 RepID=UPI0026324E42|nr:aromatic ring-hydroxylating dioxygenase subunit alpha [Erythrobacter sp.]MDJ0978565.1 aromatic ring-hydroxylating dioxygenase subunit alpha [Erythrobacter sp.]